MPISEPRACEQPVNAAEAANAYLGLPAPAYFCPGCGRRPRFDGACGCS